MINIQNYHNPKNKIDKVNDSIIKTQNSDPEIIQSYNIKNNYFEYLRNVILIQSKIRQLISINKLNKLKEKNYPFIKIENLSKKQSSHLKLKTNNQKKNNDLKEMIQLSKLDCHYLKNEDNSFSKFSETESEKSETSNSIFNNSNIKSNFLAVNRKISNNTTVKSNISHIPKKNILTSSNYFSNLNNNINDPLEEEENKMRGYFLLKKQKFKHEGYIKYLTVIESENTIKKKPIKEGFGIITYSDGYKLFGNFTVNKINGFAIFISPDKTKIYKGEYERNKPKGYGIYYNKKGYLIEGTWIKNKIYGIGIERYGDGTLYKGEFKNNKKQGIGYYKWKDGTTYEGEFKNDKMDGFGILQYHNNKKYEGNFSNGLINGYGEFTFSSTKKYIGNYVNEVKEGFGIYVWDVISFDVYLGFWKNGKMNGLGVKIKGDIVKYGSWKDGSKEFWVNDSYELINLYKKGKKNRGDISLYHSQIIRKSLTSEDFDHNNAYLDLMVKSIDFLKEFIIKNYFMDDKIFHIKF